MFAYIRIFVSPPFNIFYVLVLVVRIYYLAVWPTAGSEAELS